MGKEKLLLPQQEQKKQTPQWHIRRHYHRT
jgi:hypothetical protein